MLDAKLRALAAEAANARNRGLHDKFNELGLKYHKLKDGLDKYEQRCKSTAQLSERNDKARPAVSLAIGAAIKARGTQNPKLGQYFESTIVTGAECEYTGCESASAPL